MNHIQLYINHQLTDLADDSPIALTFQINNLAEVKNQQGNTSNQFKLPLTQRNRQILGFPDDVAFTTGLPYDNYEAKIIQDGLEIIPNGIAILNGIEDNSAAITVLSGNVDFFDALNGKLYDMGDEKTPYGANQPFLPYQHTWNVNNIATSQTRTSGWIWPLIDYGNIVYNAAGNNEVNVRNLRPGFFIKTAIDLMVASVGYKAQGSLLSNPLYPLLIAQFSNDGFEHGSDYQNRANPTGLLATTGGDFNVNHFTTAGNKGIIPFTIINNDEAGQFSGSNTFTSKRISNVTVKVTIPKMRFEGRNSGDNKSYLKISIHQQTDADNILVEYTIDLENSMRVEGTSGKYRLGYTEPQNIVISESVDLVVGNQISIRYEFFNDRPSYFTIYSGATLEITPASQQVLYGQDIQCERIFPDIAQKDLLKDVLQRFGIVCQTDSATRTINFASFKDIVNNIPIAKNWTDKCLDQGKSITFQLGNFAQVNYLRYKEDDNVLPKGFGNGQINVNDKTLPATADLFESQFAPTLNRPYISNSIAQIKMAEDGAADGDFGLSVSPRILIDKKIDLRQHGGKTIKFTDGNAANDKYVNGTVSVPYFYKPGEEYSLLWEDLRKAYYPELEKILQQTKKVMRYFMLNPRDILELDLLIPVYLEQDSAYYYINKIDSWRKGQPVKVELVKLG
jgi:hypothetical protein